MLFSLSRGFVIILMLGLIQGIKAQQAFCLYFELDKSELTQDIKTEIDKTCLSYSIKDTLQIEIIGNYDSKYGKIAADLARKRCNSVWEYLLQKKNFIIFKGQLFPSSTYKPEKGCLAETSEMALRRVYLMFVPVKNGKLLRASITESLPNIPPPNPIPAPKKPVQNTPTPLPNPPKLASPSTKAITAVKPVYIESDSIITYRTGTKIKIPAGTFAPHYIKDIKFEIKEFLQPCELFALDIQMRTIEGDLLMSDGLITIQITKNGKTIKPLKPIEIWVPSEKLDTTMHLYIGEHTADKRIVWRKAAERLEFHITEARYYSFHTSQSAWFCIQKPIKPMMATKVKAKKNRFLLKNSSHPNPLVNVFYIDTHTYYELSPIEEGVYSIPKLSDPKNIMIISKVHAPNNKVWYFSKRLSELEHKKGYYRLNTEDYIVRRPDTPKNPLLDYEPTMDEVLYKLCGMFSQMKGL